MVTQMCERETVDLARSEGDPSERVDVRERDPWTSFLGKLSVAP